MEARLISVERMMFFLLGLIPVEVLQLMGVA